MRPRTLAANRACRTGTAFAANLAALLIFCFCAPAARGDITNERIGNPTWNLVDTHTFVAPLTSSDSLGVVYNQLLPPPNHGATGPGTPGAPHPGPYDHEFADGIARQGYHETYVLGASEFTNPNGIYHSWMLIPTAGASTGSSPDFASGPILQNDLFPLRVDHVLMRGSTTIFNVTRFTTLPGTWPYDGYSHVPGLGNGSATSLGLSSPLGDYLYVRTIRDSAGNGWRSRITARVVPDSAIPEPGTLALLLSGIAPLAAVWKLRR